jgi:hypothetical protein
VPFHAVPTLRPVEMDAQGRPADASRPNPNRNGISTSCGQFPGQEHLPDGHQSRAEELAGEYDTVNMSASQAKDLQPDTKSSRWHDREQLMFWSALFATALFVFVAVSTATDGYIHPPLVTVGAPLATLIGFSTFVVLGARLFGKVCLWKVVLAVACMAGLPAVVKQLLEINRTPPNVHTGTVVVFFAYAALSELTAAAALATTLVRIGLHRN